VLARYFLANLRNRLGRLLAVYIDEEGGLAILDKGSVEAVP
jgi:hypothetical protein